MVVMLGHLSYLTLLAAGALLIGQAELRVGPQVLMVFGVIGAWRYGWMGINFARAAYFLRRRFFLSILSKMKICAPWGWHSLCCRPR